MDEEASLIVLGLKSAIKQRVTQIDYIVIRVLLLLY